MTGTVASGDLRLSLRTCLGFGVGTVGVSIMLNTVTAYFPAFMSTVLGQSPEVAGYLLMGSKLYDAFADVLIGRLSDATRSRWGRRRPYLLAGGVLSAASFLMLFAPPVLSHTALIAYMAGALILYSTGYSLFNVPYMTMPSEMTQGFHERTRLLSFRTLFVSIGQLLALAATAALIERGGRGAAGFAMMGLVMALIIFAAMTATFFGTAGTALVAPAPARAAAARRPGGQMALLLQNRPFMLLLGAKIFQFLAFASIATTGLLFLLNVLGVGYRGQIILTVSQNGALALSMPLWVRLGRQIGKRATYLIGVALFCVGALSWLFAGAGVGTAGLLARGVVSGAGSGSLILMSVSMLGDTMAYDRALTGLHREGLLSSIVAVIEKTAFALGVAIVGVLLHIAGYIPTFGGKIVAQPASAVRALYIGYAVIPIVMFLANGVFLYLYDLDERKLRDA